MAASIGPFESRIWPGCSACAFPDQFAAGGDDSQARPRDHPHEILAERRQHSNRQGSHAHAGRQVRDRPGGIRCPGSAMFWPGTSCAGRTTSLPCCRVCSLGTTASVPGGQGSAGQDGQATAVDKRPFPIRAGRNFPDHGHGLPRIGQADGKTVHHRSRKGRIIAVGDDIFREHQAAGRRPAATLRRAAARPFDYQVQGFVRSDHHGQCTSTPMQHVDQVLERGEDLGHVLLDRTHAAGQGIDLRCSRHAGNRTAEPGPRIVLRRTSREYAP